MALWTIVITLVGPVVLQFRLTSTRAMNFIATHLILAGSEVFFTRATGRYTTTWPVATISVEMVALGLRGSEQGCTEQTVFLIQQVDKRDFTLPP